MYMYPKKMNNFHVFLINQVQVQELQFIKDIWAALSFSRYMYIP